MRSADWADPDLSAAAVLLDTIADAAAAAGVATAGAIILATRGWYWLDGQSADGIAGGHGAGLGPGASWLVPPQPRDYDDLAERDELPRCGYGRSKPYEWFGRFSTCGDAL